MRKIIDKILGLLYPNVCCFCGEISKEPICEKCKKKVIYIHEPRCKKCGKPIRLEEQEYCFDCKKTSFSYEQGKSVWLHKTPVSDSIYQFKYRNRRIFARFYAKEMCRLYGEWIKKCEIDVIIPVPIHAKRRRKRGYNQAEVLAKYVARETGIPMCAKAVKRERKTQPQKELDVRRRRHNLANAFSVARHWKQWRNVLIVDDIYTTGSTIDALAKRLKEKGARNIWFLTISIGQGF